MPLQASLIGVGADAIGETIAEIRVSGNDRTRKDYILLESELEVGQIISIQRLNFALQELRDTDLFTDIHMQTERLENGEILLHIIVVERRFFWLLLPRASRNSSGDIKAGFRLTMYNLWGSGHEVDLLGQQEQQSDGDEANELRLSYVWPKFKKHYDLGWRADRVVTETTVEDFDNVVTRDRFGFTVARDKDLGEFATPLTFAAGIDFERRMLDEPFPESIEAREPGTFNSLSLSIIYDDVHRERYRRFGNYYGGTYTQGFDWLGSDYDSSIFDFEILGFNRLNSYDNFNYRGVLEFSNNPPYDSPMFGIGGGSTIRGLEGYDEVGNARLFGNFELVFAYRKKPGIRHTLFIDVGNVYDRLEDVYLGDLRYTVGTGFRWKIESFVRTDLIIDYGYDVEGGQGKLYGGTSLNF
jgi:outer membrane protein assembly factor BamA